MRLMTIAYYMEMMKILTPSTYQIIGVCVWVWPQVVLWEGPLVILVSCPPNKQVFSISLWPGNQL